MLISYIILHPVKKTEYIVLDYVYADKQKSFIAIEKLAPSGALGTRTCHLLFPYYSALKDS